MTYSNVLVLHVSDVCKSSASDIVAQLLSRRVWVDVAEIDVPVTRLVDFDVAHIGLSKSAAGEER